MQNILLSNTKKEEIQLFQKELNVGKNLAFKRSDLLRSYAS